jgi:hypothetical protein
MFRLKFGPARDQPAHREGRKRRYVEHFAGLTTVLDTQRGTREPVERRPGLGQQIRPGPRRHGVAAAAQEEAGAEPFVRQANCRLTAPWVSPEAGSGCAWCGAP